MKIMKTKMKNNEKLENNRIPIENLKNQENVKTSCENHKRTTITIINSYKTQQHNNTNTRQATQP